MEKKIRCRRGIGRYFGCQAPEEQRKALSEYRQALEEELGDIKKEEGTLKIIFIYLDRCISFRPNVYYFKPQGVPLRLLDEVVLQPDELEALWLYDV